MGFGGNREIQGILKVDLKLIYKGAAGFPQGGVVVPRDLGTSSWLCPLTRQLNTMVSPTSTIFPEGFSSQAGHREENT